MPDVFDEIAPDQTSTPGDIFDQVAPSPAAPADTASAGGDVFNQVAPDNQGDIFDQVAAEPKAPDSGFLASAGASIRKSVYNTAAAVNDVMATVANMDTPEFKAFDPQKQHELNMARVQLIELERKSRLSHPVHGYLEFKHPQAGLTDEERMRQQTLVSKIQSLTRNPIWEDASQRLRTDAAESFDLYGANEGSSNIGAQFGRGVGGVIPAIPLMGLGGVASLPAAVTQMSGSAGEEAITAKQKELAAAGLTDPDVIFQQSQAAGKNAAMKSVAALGLYMLAGRAGGAVAAKLVGEGGSMLAKTLASFGGAVAANVSSGTVLRALEAPPGKAAEAALPKIENLTADTLFAVFHAHGEYSKASEVAKKAAEAELKKRGFDEEQLKNPPPPGASAPATEIMTTEDHAARTADAAQKAALAEEARAAGLTATADALDKQSAPPVLETGSTFEHPISGTQGPPIDTGAAPGGPPETPAELDEALGALEGDLKDGRPTPIPEIHRPEIELIRALKSPIPEDVEQTPPAEQNIESSLNRQPAEPVPEPPVEPPQTEQVSPTETQVFGKEPVKLPVKDLELSKDVPQFKAGADARGIVKPLEGTFDETNTAPIQVWRRLNGRLEVISGRHRFDLAQRSGTEKIWSQIHDEASGFDARAAARLDAELNIRDEHGSTADYANYFRHSDISEEDASARGLLGRAKGRAGFSIARGASEDVFALHQSERLSDAQAEGIADAAPKNEEAQRLGLRLLFGGSSIADSTNAVRAALVDAKASASEQGDFFANTGLDEQWLKQGKIASAQQKSLREDIASVQGAAKKPELAKKFGVDVQDPEGVKKRIAQLRADLGRWENWPSHPDLVAITKGEKPKAAELPKLRQMQKQGDLLSSNPEDLTLVGESADDGARIAAEKAAEEKAAVEAKAEADKNQGNLFGSKADQPLQDAYERLVKADKFGLPAVSIGKLAAESGMDLEALKAKLLALHKAGKVVLSQGDWSHADDQTRAGAVEVNGDRMLQVRPLNPDILESKLPASPEATLGGKVRTALEKAPSVEDLAGKPPGTISFDLAGGAKVTVQNTKESLQLLIDRYLPKGEEKHQQIVDLASFMQRELPGLEIEAHRNESDVPGMQSRLGGGLHEGVANIKTGKVYLFTDNLKSAERAREVILHEAIGHHGVNAVLPYDHPDWQKIADTVFRTDPSFAGKIARAYVNRERDFTPDERAKVALEYVARLAEKPASNPTVWRQVVDTVRRALRALGITRNWSEADIADLLRRGAKAAKSRDFFEPREGGLNAAVRDLGKEVDQNSPYAKHIEDAFKAAVPDESARDAIAEYVRAKLARVPTPSLSSSEKSVAERFLTYFRTKSEFAKRNDVQVEAQKTYEEALAANPSMDLPEKLASYSAAINKAVSEKTSARGTPAGPGISSPTSIKNAVVDQERVKYGLAPAMEPARKAFASAWDNAMTKMDADPMAGAALVDQLEKSPKAMSDDEDALLLHRQITVQTQYEEAARATIEAHDSGDPAAVEENRLRTARLADELQRIYDVGKRAGTENARGLNARKMMGRDDYSLANLVVRKRAANGGKPLDPEQQAETEQLALKIGDKEKEIEKDFAAKDEKNATAAAGDAMKSTVDKIKPAPAKLAKAPPVAKKTSGTTANWIEKQAQAARDRIKARGPRLQAGLDPVDLADRVIVGAADIAFGLRDFASWALKQIRDWGEPIRPHLQEIWDKANAALSLHETVAGAAEKMKARIEKDGENLGALRPYVQKIAEGIVKSGVTELPALLDQLHPILADIVPDITRRRVMDLFSGYGEFKQLNKEQIKVQTRDLRGQAQQIGKIEDMQAGLPPKKTGVEQRTPSSKERALIKEVEQLKRRGNFRVTDPETQLKTAQGAITTRLKNQIRDLTTRFETGVRPPDKSPVEWNQEMESLRALRDNIQSTLDAVEAKPPGRSDAQRERMTRDALQRSIDEYTRRLQENDFSAKGKKHGPDSALVDSLRAQHEALKAEFDELRELDEQVSRQRAERREADLEDQIRELDKKLQSGDISTAPKVSGEKSSRAEDLAAERDAMRQQLDKMRRDANRKVLTPAEKYAAAMKRSLKAYKTRSLQRISELESKIASGDYSVTPAKNSLRLDPAALKMQADLQRLKDTFERGLIADRLSKRGTIERALDGVAKWRRALILSGASTMFKLASAATEIVGISSIEEAAGGMLGLLPGVHAVAERAPRHGGLNLNAEIKAVSDTFTNLFSDFGKYMKTGGTDLDAQYGKSHLYPFELKEMIGRLHGALKTPARRNEWVRSYEKRLAFADKIGADVTDPMVQTKIAAEAYKDANKSIFMEDNRLVDGYKRFLSRFSQIDKRTGKVLISDKAIETAIKISLPVVRIPSNIVARTFEYSVGLLYGAGKLGFAMSRGIENLHPEDADLIMQHLKRGSLGAAVLALGFLNPGAFGGYYQGKRDERDVKPGGMRINGINVPKVLIHNPLLEQLQIGATVRRVMDSKVRKTDKETRGLPEAIWAAATGMAEQTPFVGQMLRTAKAFVPHGQSEYFGDLLRSFVPPLVNEAADIHERATVGANPPRAPKTAFERMKVAIPGARETVPLRKKR